MGSFWNCEFSLFYYGQNTRTSAEISRLCKSFYAWKLPSAFSLSASDCNCGSCLLREEFSKDALPEWIDCQQKKDIVLAFASSMKILLSNCLSQRILNVPDQPQLPPFTFQNPTHCSNKWPRKMQHCNALVGPAVPLHFLMQDLATSMLESWNLMDTSFEEQQMFQNVIRDIAASEHEIKEANMLSVDAINIMFRLFMKSRTNDLLLSKVILTATKNSLWS
ncbi:hypothetical protein ACET3Z_028446 [Daucus carota]